MSNIYYTYVYVDPRKPHHQVGNYYFEGEPFYVGKGKNKRAWTHLSESASNTHNTLKFEKIQRILNSGQKPQIVLVEVDISEREALDHEKRLISLIGTKWNIEGIKRGPLCNMTSGGDGVTPCEELRNKSRHVGSANGMFGRTHTKTARERISAARKNFRHSERTKQQMKLVRNSEHNPHNESWIVVCPDHTEISTTYLRKTCQELNLTYMSLYTSYKNNKPISRGPMKGYRLIKVTE